jgi:hypothetical protein
MKDRSEASALDHRPYIVVVDENDVDLELLSADIRARYGGAYRVSPRCGVPIRGMAKGVCEEQAGVIVTRE